MNNSEINHAAQNIAPNIDQDIAIYCENLSKDFYLIDDKLNWKIVFRDSKQTPASYPALQDVSLTVPKGKFLGILGRNGAGKSTLLRLLGGIYPPSSGIIHVTGQISGLFELGGFGNNRLTGYAYANRYLTLAGIKKGERQNLIHEIQDFSELEDSFHKPLYTYSSGMLARLYFSTATQLQYEIYLVDELLSVGDEHFQAKCWKRLRSRFSNGASGILVTHDWPAVLKVCESAYILEKGKIATFGPSEKMVQQYLNLPVPTKEYAEFLTVPENQTFESGRDCEIHFTVLIKKQALFAASYSVDSFHENYGWEMILLHEDYVNIETKVGINSCKIKIDKLPLVQGEYYLNLFLRKYDDVCACHLKTDVRSWTYGNGIKIHVKGNNINAATILPWKMQVLTKAEEKNMTPILDK